MTHPSDAELLLAALGDAESAAARHARECELCYENVDALRGIVRVIGTSAPNAGNPVRGECLDEDQLAAFVDGAGDDRSARVVHIAGCGRCRAELAALVELLADPELAPIVARVESDPTSRGRERRWVAGAGLIAAAAAVLLITIPRNMPEPSPPDRDPTITAAATPAPLSPVGDVADAVTLRWASVPGADRYRITLHAATGAAVFETQTTDTSVAIPDSVVIVPGQSYLWKVEARTAWERWASSELVEFRIRGAQPTPRDSLRLRGRQLSDAALAAEIRAHPQEVREALTGTLALAVHAPAAERAQEIAFARRLASAYATAWNDDFLAREVARFSTWPHERRATKVTADSLRIAGVEAFGRDGATAAIALWRRAAARATSIGDSAGMASALGNIGMGFSREYRPDSGSVYLERSCALATAIGDVRTQANAISELAGVSESRGDIATARDRYARAIALRERIGDSRGLAADLNNLAGLAQSAGDLAEARRQYEAAFAINRRDGRASSAATNLVNLAGLASLTGDFARAEPLYRQALTTWKVEERWADAADALRGLGDLELRRGDYPAARATLLQALTIYDRTGPFEDAVAMRQAIAGARAAEGDLQGALDELRLVQHLADLAKVAPGVRAGITLARADLAVQFSARRDAERLYAGAERLFRSAGDRAGEAEAQQGRGLLLLDQDEAARAQDLFDVALRTQMATGNQRAASLTRVLLGGASLRRGDTVAARRNLARASAELERLGDPVAAASALGEYAMVTAAAGFPAAAESLFIAALGKVGNRVAPGVTWRLHAGLGAVRRDRGAKAAAVTSLRAAVADIEWAGASLALAERRSGFLADKWDVYVDLALVERARGGVAAAFDASERMRAGEMLALLSHGRVAAPRDTAAALVAREQDLRRRIAELTRGLEDASGAQLVRGPDVTSSGAVTREALLRAQESYAALLLEVRESAPRHAALVAPAAASWRDVARRLVPNEAVIEYLISDDQSLAFVVTRDTIVAVTLPARRRELARLVDFTRGTLRPRGTPRLDSLWRAPLRQLHGDLIAPILATGLLKRTTRLTIIPHAELHYLPFAALVDGSGRGRFLIEQFEVSVTPSASVWLALGARPAPRGASGMLALAPRPDALPASRHEVGAIERLGGGTTRVAIGAGATESMFRREAPTRRVIHLATYGVLNKQNPLFSFVELAPGGAEDGRLEAHEVFGLHLAADLVVLSACQTALASGALSDVPPGDDWIGLARAFLSAGAARVLASLWPVQDRATAVLMEEFYKGFLANNDPARALATAQRTLLASPATASPYYWAGFEVVGGR